MKIEAKLLQDSLAFLGLAISKNASDRPITKMLELCTENGFLVGTTCDGVNSLRLKICTTTEDIKALVEFEFFSNLIKSCSGEIELKTTDIAVNIKSDSMKCKVPSIYNRPNTSMPHLKMETCTTDIDFSNLSDILPICKSIIDPNFSIECYRHVYFGDKIMITDTNNVAVINKKYFSESALLSYKTVEILSKLKNAKYTFTNEIHRITNKEFRKFYIQTDNVDFVCISNYMHLFQYNDLNDLFSLPTKESLVINRAELSKGYNTAKLFKNAKIQLVFDVDSVYLSIERSDFVYKVCNVGTSTKHIFDATEDLMKKILTLSDDITISILDSMIKCTSNNIEEIFSAEEVTTQ